MTIKKWKAGIAKAKDFFIKRDVYRIQLRDAIRKYGIAALSEDVLKTVPADTRILYEMSWKWNIIVRWRILQIGWVTAQHEMARSIENAD